MNMESTDGPTVECWTAEEDGRIVVHWPEGRGPVKASPELVEAWAAQVNELRAEVERLRACQSA